MGFLPRVLIWERPPGCFVGSMVDWPGSYFNQRAPELWHSYDMTWTCKCESRSSSLRYGGHTGPRLIRAWRWVRACLGRKNKSTAQLTASKLHLSGNGAAMPTSFWVTTWCSFLGKESGSVMILVHTAMKCLFFHQTHFGGTSRRIHFFHFWKVEIASFRQGSVSYMICSYSSP